MMKVNKNLTLTKSVVATSKYRGRSKFRIWKEMKPGDVLHLAMVIKSQGRSSNGTYVEVHNTRLMETRSFTVGAMQDYLNRFDYQEMIEV